MRLRKYPQILGYAVDKLNRGWAMLTVTERGLGLSPDEARRHTLLNPQVLYSDFEKFTKCVELLESLGFADAHRMGLAQPRVLNYEEQTVREHAAWWKQTGLDYMKLVSTLPTLLGGVSVDELQARLVFLSRVAGMSAEQLNNAHALFTLRLDGRLRTRYFYALLTGKLGHFTSMNTMFKETDATFLAMLQGHASTHRASELEVKRYEKLTTSAKFIEWRERIRQSLANPAPGRRDVAK